MATKTNLGLPRNTTAALAYLLGWLSGLVILLTEKDDKFIRFHAMQSIIFFGLVTVVGFIPFIGWILFPVVALLGLVFWIVCLVKAYQGEEYMIPFIGQFAKDQLKKIK